MLTLHRHDGAYSIKANGEELMSTRRHASEDRLAELVCVPLARRGVENTTVLVGGLGLGFTLRAALRSLTADARVVVAEIVADVIRWNENPAYGFSSDAMHDSRVEVHHGDVAGVLEAGRERFDGIMLDVDNGAEPMTMADNARLYGADGIRMAVAALRPGGLLGYWSSTADAEFEQTLRATGVDVAVTRVRAHATSGPRHSVYVCARR